MAAETRGRRPSLLLAAIAVAASGFVVHSAGDQAPKAHDRQAEVPRPPAKPPVVMIAFDEFPADVIREPDGRIDATRFPHFAALARTSTWFVNAQASHDSRPRALPAILDGRKPKPDAPATVVGHPTSVFTLFGDRGYDIVSSEEATDICPARLCPGAAKRRKGILTNLKGGRWGRLERWIARIRRRTQPTFYFKHSLLPHHPWVFLPSGKHTVEAVGHLTSPSGFHDPDLTKHNGGRLLLQTGFVDRAIGQVLDRLRHARMLRNTLIVVTADHGISSDLGVKDRRTVTPQNIDEVANVPLFIKAPGQTHGQIDPAVVHTTDIVPTIGAVLHVHVPWRTVGRSSAPRSAPGGRSSCPHATSAGTSASVCARWSAAAE